VAISAILPFVEHHAAEEQHVVVHHVPFDVVAAREPVGGVDGLVAVDRDEILRGGQLPVEIVGRDRDRFVLGETARRIFHDGERFGQDFVELLFDLLVDAFGDLVDLFEIFSFSSSAVSARSSCAFRVTMRSSSGAMKSAICFISAWLRPRSSSFESAAMEG